MHTHSTPRGAQLAAAEKYLLPQRSNFPKTRQKKIIQLAQNSHYIAHLSYTKPTLASSCPNSPSQKFCQETHGLQTCFKASRKGQNRLQRKNAASKEISILQTTCTQQAIFSSLIRSASRSSHLAASHCQSSLYNMSSICVPCQITCTLPAHSVHSRMGCRFWRSLGSRLSVCHCLMQVLVR